MTPLLPADFTQPSLQIILRINLDGTAKDSSDAKNGKAFRCDAADTSRTSQNS